MNRTNGPWLLLVPLAVMFAAMLYLSRERGDDVAPARGGTPSSAVVDGLAGDLEFAGRVLGVRLAPLHGEPAMQEHEARVLGRRLELPEGAPWRLVLSGDSPLLDEAEVVDEDGVALQPLARFLHRADGASGPDPDPLRVLLGARLPLADGAVGILLWGRTPVGASRLVSSSGKPGGAPSSCPLVPDGTVCGELPRHVARLPAPAPTGTERD